MPRNRRPDPLDGYQRLGQSRGKLDESAVHEAIRHLVRKFFLGIIALGLATGVLLAMEKRMEGWEFVYAALGGVVVAIIASTLGGFLGELMRDWSRARKGSIVDSMVSDGIYVSAFFLGFVGAVLGLIIWTPGATMATSAFGLFAGGMLGALPGDSIRLSIAMFAMDSSTGQRRKKR
jgi:hypothetical protein